MIKILELIGFALIVMMFITFVGWIPGHSGTSSPLFWGCAVGALGIILYRRKKRKEKEKEST